MIHCAGGRHREPTSRQATTARCSASWRAPSTASSSIPRSRRTCELLRGLLATADAVVWSRGSTIAALDEFSPAALADAHPHLTVTAITPFGLEGPWADNPATEFTVQAWSGGVIGLGRGAQDRAPLFVGGQIGEWLAGAYAAAGTMAVRSRPRRRLDARNADPLPHLLFGVVHRRAGPSVARSAPAHHPRRRDGGRRAGGAGLRHRAAVVRPVRHDRSRRMDRRGVGALHHRSRPTSTPSRSTSGYARTTSTTSSTCRPPSGFPTRRSETAPTSRRSTSSSNEERSSPIRATGSPSRGSLPHDSVAHARHRNPRPGSASTPTTIAETDIWA